MKEFLKLSPTREFVDMLVADVARRLLNNWHGRHKSKIPHPSTYLIDREWEGDIYQASTMVASTNVHRYTLAEVMGA